MGISYPKRARPILREHDYDAVKVLLQPNPTGTVSTEVAERIEALTRELEDYEGRDQQHDPVSVAAWSEFVMVPMVDEEARPHRRHSDRREPVAHPLTEALFGRKLSIDGAQ